MKKLVVHVVLVFILCSLVLVLPASAAGGSTDSDTIRLTELLQIINNEGWNQAAVDSANDILSNKSHDSLYWQTFFTGFFSQHPFSDNLKGYLIYPVFGWFDDDVHRNLQNGLAEALKSNILRITIENPNLGLALQNDPLLFQSLVNSNNFLEEICQRNIVDLSVKQGVFSFYKNYILTHPQYYNSAVTIDSTTNRFLSITRVQVYLSFRHALPLTPGLKEEISSTLGLQGKYRDIFINHSILVIDNNGLDAAQLDFIDRYISNIPQEMHNLETITVDKFIDNFYNGPPGYYYGTRINIFGDKIGSYPEPQFPPDISPGYLEIFCSALAHEFNHDVDAYRIVSDPVREARKNALIDAAGTNHMNYLRSMIDDGVFYNSRQEFFASLSNQWFCNSSHVLDLGISRFNNGYKDPINQFIFYADIYSNGNDNTLFYNIDRNGNIIKTSIPVFRDNNGHINKILVNNLLYTFTLDNDGNVLGITSSAPGTITVTSPNGGESWVQGSTHAITWTSSGTVGSSVKVEVLKGNSVVQTLSTSTENDGTYSWTIPTTLATGTDYRVRITSTTNAAITDVSNNYFTITTSIPPPITVASPNGGEIWNKGTSYPITWSSTGSLGSSVNIAIFKDNSFQNYIVSNVPIGSGGSGSYTWQIPAGTATGSDYKIGIQSASQTNIYDLSNNDFTITPATTTPTITVTAPNGGESWIQGSNHAITWTSSGNVGSFVKIEVLKAGSVVQTLSSSDQNDGTFSWTIATALATGTDYRIRITSTTNTAVTDSSDAYFTITTTTPVITVTSPNGGETWYKGTSQTVTWTSSGNVGSFVKIEVLKAGSVVQTLSSSDPNDGTYSWTIPTTLTIGTDYRVRITSTTNTAVTDSSNADFTLNPAKEPTITVTSPFGGESWIQGSNHAITWTSDGDVGSFVKIEVLKAGSVVQTLSSSDPNDGTFSWTIPTTLAAGTDYLIRITSTTNPGILGHSNANFAITPVTTPTITVTAPNGAESWVQSSNHAITWTSDGDMGSNVKIEVLKAGSVVQTLSSNDPNDGTFSWTIATTLAAGTDYRIRITSTTNTAITDSSNANFAITSGTTTPSITVTSPNGGETWYKGTSYTITWSSTGSLGSSVNIAIFKSNSFQYYIASNVPIGSGGSGSYTWQIPAGTATGSNYKIGIQSASQTDIYDLSNNAFAITS